MTLHASAQRAFDGARTLTLVPRPARCPWLRARFDHEADKAARGTYRLNEESLVMAHLYQHASIAVRGRLYEWLRLNECDCYGCEWRIRKPLQ